ncbi:MAG: LytR/AlgR family response regulator transcription factor [Bacillota bacterium]
MEAQPLDILIVEDEEPARAELKYLLAKIDGARVVGEAVTGDEAIALARRLHPQVVLLDIQIPVVPGTEVAKALSRLPEPPVVVFSTAYESYALDAFDLEATDYLLKPYTAERLARALHRARLRIQARSPVPTVEQVKQAIKELGMIASVKIPVSQPGTTLVVDSSKVSFAVARHHSTCIRVDGEDLVTRLTLSELEELLKGAGFLRVHKAYLVNLRLAKELVPWFNGTYRLKLADKGTSVVPVSRFYAAGLKRALNL